MHIYKQNLCIQTKHTQSFASAHCTREFTLRVVCMELLDYWRNEQHSAPSLRRHQRRLISPNGMHVYVRTYGGALTCIVLCNILILNPIECDI